MRIEYDHAAVPASDPAVTAAVNALRAFGDDIDRDTAEQLLIMWRHTPELTDRERAAVLAQFGSKR
jgi:hypothetical protein